MLLMTMATFTAGSISGSTAYIMINTTQDEDYEGTHSFTLDIGTPSGPAVNDSGSAEVQITEDDGK